MIAVIAALSAVAVPAPDLSIPPASLDPTLEVAGEGLAARQLRTRMFVDVAVDGRGPYRFLVDSGADRSVVGRGLAARLALPAAGNVVLQGVAGASRVDTVRVASLTVGRSVVEDIVAPVLAEADLGADGLLGIDALADQRLKFDFDARTITIQDTRQPMPAGRDEIIVTARRRKGQLILTQARIGETGIAAVIDSGAEVTIANSSLRAAIYRHHPPVARTVSVISVTGQSVEAELVVLPRVTIGGITLDNVTVAFADIPPFRLFGLDRQPALMLGTDLLQSFRQVSLDFRHRRIRFLLRR